MKFRIGDPVFYIPQDVPGADKIYGTFEKYISRDGEDMEQVRIDGGDTLTLSPGTLEFDEEHEPPYDDEWYDDWGSWDMMEDEDGRDDV